MFFIAFAVTLTFASVAAAILMSSSTNFSGTSMRRTSAINHTRVQGSGSTSAGRGNFFLIRGNTAAMPFRSTVSQARNVTNFNSGIQTYRQARFHAMEAQGHNASGRGVATINRR